MITMLVAVDKNWAIGNKGDLLIKIPEDIKFFKEITIGNVVIMGRKTLESLPQKKPLKDRVNIVVTQNTDYQPEGVIITKSVEEAVEKAKEFTGKEIYHIGGGKLFHSMMEYCDAAYVTYIDAEHEADTYFPNLDNMPEWVLECESEEKNYEGLKYWFRKYIKKH